MDDDITAVVLDNGSGMCKAGCEWETRSCYHDNNRHFQLLEMMLPVQYFLPSLVEPDNRHTWWEWATRTLLLGLFLCS